MAYFKASDADPDEEVLDDEYDDLETFEDEEDDDGPEYENSPGSFGWDF